MFRADRIKLLLLLGLFAAPALAAWVAHQFLHPTMSASYGELMQPVAVELPGLSALRGRWVLLTIAKEECGPDCRQQLDLIRRVHIAQGRNQARVAQVLIQPTTATPFEQDGCHSFLVPIEALSLWSDPLRTYLVDPLGRVMLRFPVEADGKGMLHDLRRLLLASRIG